MKFKIILYECDKSQKITWYLSSEHTLACRVPLSFILDQDKTHEIICDLVRREGGAIYKYLQSLNKGYYLTNKFKYVSVEYSNKSKHKNKITLDNLLEGLFLANYKFNKYKTNFKSTSLNILTTFNNPINSASIIGACIARDLVNEPLSHLNAAKLSVGLKKLAKE